MITRALVPLLLALLLVGALVELSCVAAEHGASGREAPGRLVPDVDPPSALEIEGGDAAENATGPFLTR
jgi:hypothetical protein